MSNGTLKRVSPDKMPSVWARTFLTPVSLFLCYIQYANDIQTWVLFTQFEIEGKRMTSIIKNNNKASLMVMLSKITTPQLMELYGLTKIDKLKDVVIHKDDKDERIIDGPGKI